MTPDQQVIIDPFEAGRLAYDEGVEERDCPYPQFTYSWYVWRRGWRYQWWKQEGDRPEDQ